MGNQIRAEQAVPERSVHGYQTQRIKEYLSTNIMKLPEADREELLAPYREKYQKKNCK